MVYKTHSMRTLDPKINYPHTVQEWNEINAPRTSKRCGKCGFRIRGKNHEDGAYHKNGENRKAKTMSRNW